MSNEIKIGLLAVVAISILVVGYKFLRGQNVLTAAGIYYADYDNVDMLKSSSPILLNGLQIGVVTEVYIRPEDNREEVRKRQIRVEMRVEKGVNVPNNTIALIIDQGFMGGKAIDFILDEPCTSADPCPEKTNYLRGREQSFLTSVIGRPEEIGPWANALSKQIGPIIDSLEAQMKGGEEAEGLARTLHEVSETVTNLKRASEAMNHLLQTTSRDISGITSNLAGITATLDESNEEVKEILGNSADFTGKLTELELEKTIDQANEAMGQLKSALADAQNTFSTLNGIASKIENGEGLLGQLIAEDSPIAADLLDMMNSADSLFTDIQDRPYRYSPLKSRKRVKRYDRKDSEERN